MTGVQVLAVSDADADQRLDRWFRRLFPHIPQARIEKMCRKGEIRVDGGRVKPATRLQAGQEVRIPPLADPVPEDALPAARVQKSSISDAEAQMMRRAVIYQDDHLIAINKPAGLPTQGGSGQGGRHVDALAACLARAGEDKPRLVHRLDKDTSGVLLLARSRQAAQALTDAFRHRETRKIYWAAVAGTPLPRMGKIKFGLVKAAGHGKAGEGEKMRCLHPSEIATTEGAKRAETDYATLSALGGRVSWMAMVPITGRTHQLRAHIAELGHPIVGDGKYGGSGQENLGDGWGAQLGGEISRKLHLHARYLKFQHPFTKRDLTLTAALPDHMARTWELFDWRVEDVPVDPFYETLG